MGGPGVIPRAAQYLFQRFNEIRAQAAANNIAPPTFQLSCTFLELYNEKFYDLLTTRRTTPLKLVDQGANGAEIQNATVEDVRRPRPVAAARPWRLSSRMSRGLCCARPHGCRCPRRNASLPSWTRGR